ncbi:unnamed protein product, partial [Ixodes pacificus]
KKKKKRGSEKHFHEPNSQIFNATRRYSKKTRAKRTGSLAGRLHALSGSNRHGDRKYSKISLFRQAELYQRGLGALPFQTPSLLVENFPAASIAFLSPRFLNSSLVLGEKDCPSRVSPRKTEINLGYRSPGFETLCSTSTTKQQLEKQKK